MALAHSSGIAATPDRAPERAPATAAVVSASRPMFTAVRTEEAKSPPQVAKAPNARPTASGARSVQG